MKNFIARLRGDSTRGNEGKRLQYYATDVDYALIVVTPKDPTFNYLILDKYLTLCEYGNVPPLIVVNKSDLAHSLNDPDLAYYEKTLQIPVIRTSTFDLNSGVELLKKTISNKICVLLGKSGVGKSSLVNALSERLNLDTGEVSKKYGEGKHTTSTTTKYEIGENTWIIDTPGLRNIDVSNIDPYILKELFKDFTEYSDKCKFSNCMHLTEIGCEVKKAVERNVILNSRYESYLKMQNN